MSNRSSGAVGIPNILVWTYYFWKKDCETGFIINNPDYYLRQCFQKLIYRLNQPFMRIDQSAFVNVSIFDREYYEALFGGLVFPDGSCAFDYTDEFMEHQKVFMEVVSAIRQENMFTFPVLTYSLLYKDGKFVDEEFARWCSDHNCKWNDSNFFVSGDVTTLSNCCRLLSDTSKLKGFINSIGGTALSIGSVKVNTINLVHIFYELGEEVTEKIDFLKFGRRAILTLRQTLASKILELEHDALYNKYADRVGEMISAEVYQTWKSEALLLDEDGNELHLLKNSQVPRDFFHKGDHVRAVIDRVDNANGNPKIYLSRTSPMFLQRLLETEIPEFADGVIRLQRVARIPGERAKIAVDSTDERIDPVGACVGVKGARITSIVRELHNESIDVIQYSPNPRILIARALAPAEISSIELDEENKKADVFLKPDQVSLAIGKGGQNVRLAAKLTGCKIDITDDLAVFEEAQAFADQLEAVRKEASLVAAKAEEVTE
jgi:transcription termination factor NusA